MAITLDAFLHRVKRKLSFETSNYENARGIAGCVEQMIEPEFMFIQSKI